jgi:urease accessory protein
MSALPASGPRRWAAQLQLGFGLRDGETRLTECRHSGPLRVQRPFYPEARQVCHVYLLHPPGGLVSGDELRIDIGVQTDAWALLTTPGAGKVYRSDGSHGVSQQQRLRVADRGTLEWLPQECIFYDGARAELRTRVELEGSARFLGWEISCLGRPASNERLRHCDLRQRFELWHEGRPLWLERSRYEEHSPVFEAAWGLRGHGVVGTLVCTGAPAGLAARLRDALAPCADALFGVTQRDGVLVCRYLGDSAEQARTCLGAAWGWLRQEVLGRPALRPRIWNC